MVRMLQEIVAAWCAGVVAVGEWVSRSLRRMEW